MNKWLLVVGCWLLVVGLIGMVVGSEASYCCERTNEGVWCGNDAESNCDVNFKSAPTSCGSTSYCKLGTCYDSGEGICMSNTPANACTDGVWDERDVNAIPQCQLGCCVIADQAAFVSLVRCKKLSSLFGVENDYRADITNEVACIATAQSQDVGACVYEKEFERICEFTTRGECGASEEVVVVEDDSIELSNEKTFYKDYLCSAGELNTNCGEEAATECYQGDVYWVDSCGNRENVYSTNPIKNYDGRVHDASDACAINDGSGMDCGNCDYMSGSRCAEYDSFTGGPSKGDYYCQATKCDDTRNNEERINGESWCVNEGVEDAVGYRHYREICDDGKVRVEPCADYRNEICLDGWIDTNGNERKDEDDFETAACRVNRWQDCVFQTGLDSCGNIDKRDCRWIDSVTGMILTGVDASSGDDSGYSNPTSGDGFSNPTGSVIAPITGESILGLEDEDTDSAPSTNRPNGICVPEFAPGLAFWEEGSAAAICGQASAKCVKVYEEGLLPSDPKKCVENCDCLDDSWGIAANRVCTALGDCGGAVNYDGTRTHDGYTWVVDGKGRSLG